MGITFDGAGIFDIFSILLPGMITEITIGFIFPCAKGFFFGDLEVSIVFLIIVGYFIGMMLREVADRILE